MKYGMIDTARLNQVWVAAAGLDDVTVAIAMAMPALAHGGRGVTAKRGGLRGGELGTLYLALALDWATKGADHGSTDKAYTDCQGEGGSTSNKTVFISDLVAAGLIKRFGKPRTGQQVVLTEAGVAQVKLVDAGLAKLAKAYSETAFEKASKAVRKAAKQAMRDGVQPEVIEAVEGSDSVEAEVEGDAHVLHLDIHGNPVTQA